MDLTILHITTTLFCLNSTPVTTGYTEIGFPNPFKNQIVTPGDTLLTRWDSIQAGCSTDGKAYLYIGLNKGDSCLESML